MSNQPSTTSSTTVDGPHESEVVRYVAPVLLVVLSFWTYQLLFFGDQPFPWIFLDNLNLIIHEAGHWLGMPFGQTVQFLGGSLWQCLLPSIFLGYFVYRRDWAGAAFGLFWVGNNLINVSYYIADAQVMALPLLGGDSSGHDWNWLLTHWNALEQAELIGQITRNLGITALLASLVFLTIVSLVQFGFLKSPK